MRFLRHSVFTRESKRVQIAYIVRNLHVAVMSKRNNFSRFEAVEETEKTQERCRERERETFLLHRPLIGSNIDLIAYGIVLFPLTFNVIYLLQALQMHFV